MSHAKNIAVVGAAGTVGTGIVSALLETGRHSITAITRSDDISVPSGVKVVKVDYLDHSSLVSAIRGHQVLIISLAVSAPKGTESKLIKAAAEADVAYIFPNGWGGDSHSQMANDAFLGEGLRASETEIETLGKSKWMRIVCGFWYEYSLGGTANRYGFDFRKKSVVFIGDGTQRINTSTLDQIGRAMAKLLSFPLEQETSSTSDNQIASPSLSQYANQCIYISSFLVSQKDMFASVLRVTNTTEADWDIQYEEATKRFQDGLQSFQQGHLTGFAKLLYARAFYDEGEGYGSSGFQRTKKLANEELGLPQEDLDEKTKSAVDRAEEFRKFALE